MLMTCMLISVKGRGGLLVVYRSILEGGALRFVLIQQ